MKTAALAVEATVAPAESLAVTPQAVGALIACASPDDLMWKPARDRWSVSEVLGHLVDAERVLLRNARWIVEEDHPPLQTYDPTVEYAKGAYSGRSGREQLVRFDETRSRSLRFLRTVRDDAWTRTGQHPELGPLRLDQVAHLWAFHDFGHLRQITELLRATRHWEGLGPLQKHYRVRP